MKLPPPPSLVRICRFFNYLCESTAMFVLGVGGIFLIFGGLVFAAISTIGYLVFHLGGDPLKMAATGDPVLNTGAGTLSLLGLLAMPIIVLWLVGSMLRDLWKKSGREIDRNADGITD